MHLAIYIYKYKRKGRINLAKSQILAIDAGGTMTDTFIIDENGEFVVGKAQTTPDEEHIGLMNCSKDALEQWDTTSEEEFPNLLAEEYDGTVMLKRIKAHVDAMRCRVLTPKWTRDPIPFRLCLFRPYSYKHEPF